MGSSLLLLGLLTVIIRITYGLPNAAIFALLGDNVTLPCPIPSIKPCSKVNWNMGDEYFPTEVVKAGVVTANTVRLAADCSLLIDRLEQDSARTYMCGDGQVSASISLQFLQMSSRYDEAKGTMEIYCSLNTFRGLVTICYHGLSMEWLSEDNTTFKSERFKVEPVSQCFSKLIFKPKLTDHHRTWRCQLRANDTVKTSLGYTTNITGGIQEIFAVVGESVSFSCDTSSLAGGQVEWVGPQNLSGDVNGVSHPAFTFNDIDFSLAVSKVSPGHLGDYQCLSHGEQTKVLAHVRLHTLDGSAKQEGGNLTLSCLLTCAIDKCDQDVTLGWTNSSQYALLSGDHIKNTLISKLFTADVQLTGGPVVCSVYKDGVLTASKTWSFKNTAQLAAWVALPLGLLLCATGGGLYFYFKKKRERSSRNGNVEFTTGRLQQAEIEECPYQELHGVQADVYSNLQGLAIYENETNSRII